MHAVDASKKAEIQHPLQSSLIEGRATHVGGRRRVFVNPYETDGQRFDTRPSITITSGYKIAWRIDVRLYRRRPENEGLWNNASKRGALKIPQKPPKREGMDLFWHLKNIYSSPRTFPRNQYWLKNDEIDVAICSVLYKYVRPSLHNSLFVFMYAYPCSNTTSTGRFWPKNLAESETRPLTGLIYLK